MAEIRKYVTNTGANATYASDLEELNNILNNVVDGMPVNTPALLTNGVLSGAAWTAGYVLMTINGVKTIFGYPSSLTYESGKYLYCKIVTDESAFSERTDSEEETDYFQYKIYTQEVSTSGSEASSTKFLVGQITSSNIALWKKCFDGAKVKESSIGYDAIISGEGAIADCDYEDGSPSTSTYTLKGSEVIFIGADDSISARTFNILLDSAFTSEMQGSRSYCIFFDVVIAGWEAQESRTFAFTVDGTTVGTITLGQFYNYEKVIRLYIGHNASDNRNFRSLVTIGD